MMKTTHSIGLGLLLGLILGSSAMAADGGNPKKGKHLYKKECKTCHSKGDAAGELTPMSKTMAQWDRFFEKDMHKGKPEVFQKLSEQELKDVQQFLYDHAADSDQPQTCG
ncbi:cytochrome c [Shewanella amazonensis]|uniref:Cytochrome c family protein n=1 Tax=Shewanella amazonensis (strain ATCC BAA-1098 / SB2B) TaxID=326297 RepID=A1SAH4_SHEAM|nr:cytochrome c [Shewanella amazonensis]ABM01381.1 cytochrome c family protein [Shewanella amazonensis SB2B]